MWTEEHVQWHFSAKVWLEDGIWVGVEDGLNDGQGAASSYGIKQWLQSYRMNRFRGEGCAVQKRDKQSMHPVARHRGKKKTMRAVRQYY